MNTKLAAALAALITTPALAWGPATQTTTGGKAPTSAAQSYGTNANSQSQAQGQQQSAVATGGNGGAGGSGGTGGNAANNGNSQQSTYTSSPVLGAAPAIITGCSVAGTAGGASTRAAGFLGIGFTPHECYAFMLAQAYSAVGQAQAACQILNTTKAAQRAVKQGFALPNCTPPAPVVYSPPPAPEQTTEVVPPAPVVKEIWPCKSADDPNPCYWLPFSPTKSVAPKHRHHVKCVREKSE